jgi:hypothetical protein
VDDNPGFTTVTHKKEKKKPTTLLPPPQPTADRKLIFKLTSAPTVPATTAATQALRIVNKTIADHPDIIHPQCLLAHITQSNALVVIVAESYRATDYDPYLGILQEALQAENSLLLALLSVRGGLALSSMKSPPMHRPKTSNVK